MTHTEEKREREGDRQRKRERERKREKESEPHTHTVLQSDLHFFVNKYFFLIVRFCNLMSDADVSFHFSSAFQYFHDWIEAAKTSSVAKCGHEIA